MLDQPAAERPLGSAAMSRVRVEDADRVVPTWTDPVVRAASTAIGGPWGRHGIVGRAYFWTPLRVCLALALAVLALSWVEKSPCQSGEWADNVQYTHLCYSDIIPLYYSEGLDQGKVPYADHAVEYPVLTGWFMYGAATISRGYDSLARAGYLPNVNPVQSYYEATVLLLVLCGLALTWALYHLTGRRSWDTAMVALSPVLFVHAFTNWDLFVVALATGALLAWQRRVPWLAGTLIGLGAAAKFYPVLFLWPLLLVCLRGRRMREFGATLGFAVAGWAVVNLPVWYLWPETWRQFFTLNQTRSADPDTLWNVLQYLRRTALDVGLPDGGTPTVLNLAVVVSFGAVCLAIGWLALTARRRPRLPQLLFLVVAGFLLTNKVWSPQYSLWLVPLAVLARPSWRALLAWQATEALLWFPRMYWYLGTANKGLDERWFLLAVGVRDIAVVWLAVLVVRDILRPERDVVRYDGVDDPAGGPLDGAADWATDWADDWADDKPPEHDPNYRDGSAPAEVGARSADLVVPDPDPDPDLTEPVPPEAPSSDLTASGERRNRT
ncbi:MAG: DUF2029 domain-containing protein [Actinobacteria bacterium]|nr:DUF2029 domain-containing protein [Actinomycetota bacterium]MBI3687337.1 DUF2029 domain-containing protein [Actinomycetota bacterium]